MNKRLLLAGLPIEIQTVHDCLFRAEAYETTLSPVFTLRTDEKDIASEGRRSIAEAAYEGLPCPAYSPAELENTAVYRKIADRLPEYDGFVFHGSAVAVGNKAYLFTAGSGTGKTTHTNLWLKNIPGSFVVNGDKPILRIINQTVFVCGTPWMGKEGLGCNRDVPLAALCLLNRGKKNLIEKVAFSGVYPRLIGQTYRPENGALLAKTVRLLTAMFQSVPVYELYCNMEDEAAAVAFRGMMNE